MGDPVIGRRGMLRLLALCAGTTIVAAPAAAHRRRRRRRHRPVVVIDPGHGGLDPGAISPHGLYEKNITLATSRLLAHRLAATHRFRVVLTRHKDVFIPLRERVAKARAAKADLFVSIHADALPNRAMRGLSVFTLSARASDREAAEFAESENNADLVGGLDLSRQPKAVVSVLLDLARRETENLSIRLARDVVKEMGREVVLLDRPHRSADFAVLTAPDVPSVLVELGCLSNPVEERLLDERAYQRKLARGLARAIEDYFAALNAP